MLLRETCKVGTKWDEPLPPELEDQWTRWLASMEGVNSFRICRWLGCRAGCTNELHVFGDASERSYGAAGYICIRDIDGEYVNSALLMSKSKLAPKHVITVPRMELCAAVLATRLGRYLQAVMGLEFVAIYYWSDSAIILKLMLGDPANFKPFFANRISYIQSHTDPKQWDHVPTNANPADLVSRGAPMEELLQNELWLNGPHFLTGRKETWPSLDLDTPVSEVTSEMKRAREVFATTFEQMREIPVLAAEFRTREQSVSCHATSYGPELPPNVKSYRDKKSKVLQEFLELKSSLRYTVRMTAWIKRFIIYSGTGMLFKGPLTVPELEKAEASVVKANQIQYLTEEQASSKAFRKLFPVDIDGVLRVGGRLRNADLSDTSMHQYLVPANSPLVMQVLVEAHQRVGHSAVDRTLVEIRAKFWIIGGRVPIASFVRCCIKCNRVTKRPPVQLMGDLPSERVDHGTPPFWNAGVDLFGPLMVAVRRSLEKRYGAIFTCMTTRAVHIEVVTDLSSSAFLNALARFVARRGKPKRIRSDNGTNFVGGSKEVAQVKEVVESGVVQSKLADVGIEWEFNTPGASHQGGAWERMIRTIRKLMMLTLDGVSVTPDRLATGLCVIEQIINDRPLTRLTNDPDSMKPLTPSMILNLRASGKLYTRDFSGDSLRRDWRQAQWIGEQFWSHWLSRYLPELQKRHKWPEVKENVRRGDLVLVVNENLSRRDWPLGVVTEVHPGRDTLVRNVTVKTATGVYRRPLSKIVKLEADGG